MAPVTPKETAPLPSQGGDVVLRALELDELLTMSALQRQLREPGDGEEQETAHARAGAAIVAKTLALTVLLADGRPLWTEAQWKSHGAKHAHECMSLYNQVNQLSAQDVEAAAKN